MKLSPFEQRKVKRLEAHGAAGLVVADEKLNRKGDLLYYHGDWYECVSSQVWDHTILSHLNYQFVLVPSDAAGSIDLEPPVGTPVLPEQAPGEEGQESPNGGGEGP